MILRMDRKTEEGEEKMEERQISQAVIRRLPRYYRYLGELLENSVERISSNELSKRMNVTASQIRQDLNNFGQALANYAAFERSGFVLKGIFDVNPRLEGVTIRGIEIRMMDELSDFIKENNIEIAVLTIPKTKAIEVADMLVESGIKAIWNFAHTDLELPEDVIVENVHLSESLMRLSYNVNRYHVEHTTEE